MPTKTSPATTKPPTPAAQPHVLVVDDEPSLRDVLADACRGLNCRVTTVETVGQARRKLAAGRSDYALLVVDVNLPDGDGTTLLPTLRRHHPTASAVVVTGSPSVDTAVTALRGGAVDFLAKPFDHAQLVGRVSAALAAHHDRTRQARRLVRLRDAVRRLGTARRQVNQKVDLLCADLVNAYGDLARQVDAVRTEEDFRKQIAPAGDLEHLLCLAMDWVLRQLGPANTAVWLAGEDGAADFQLAAYMKHTTAGDDPLTDALARLVVPAVVRDGTLHADGADLTRGVAALAPLRGQDVVGLSITYLGEPLAVVVAFRNTSTNGFDDGHVAALKAIGPIFAAALAAAVRGPSEPAAGDGGGPTDPDGRDDAARADDWWKRGEAPPF